MLDLSKTYSEKLNIQISTAVITPDEYRFENKIYDAYYILAESNPFITSKNIQEVSNKLGIAFIAIFPSVSFKKNYLLFESFKSKYDFSEIYQKEIIDRIIPNLEIHYRFNKNYANKAIIGFNTTSLMSLTMSLDYPSHFYKVYSIGLDYSSFKAEFIANFKSKIDQRVSYYVKSDSFEDLSEIAILFGSICFKEANYNTLDELVLNLK